MPCLSVTDFCLASNSSCVTLGSFWLTFDEKKVTVEGLDDDRWWKERELHICLNRKSSAGRWLREISANHPGPLSAIDQLKETRERERETEGGRKKINTPIWGSSSKAGQGEKVANHPLMNSNSDITLDVQIERQTWDHHRLLIAKRANRFLYDVRRDHQLV